MKDHPIRGKNARGQARILEAIVAALIIFIVFTGSSLLVNRLDTTSTQERTDLDRLGYDVLNKLTESRTIEATIENSAIDNLTKQIDLKNFIRSAIPSSVLFCLNITQYIEDETWVSQTLVLPETILVSNAEPASFANSLTVSSTPTLYTSRSGKIYNLILILANGKGGT